MWDTLKPPFQHLEAADGSAPRRKAKPGRARKSHCVPRKNGSPRGDLITAEQAIEDGRQAGALSGNNYPQDNGREAAAD